MIKILLIKILDFRYLKILKPWIGDDIQNLTTLINKKNYKKSDHNVDVSIRYIKFLHFQK